MEIVWADNRPFTTCSDNLEARFYDVDLGLIKFTGGKSKSGLKHTPVPKEDMEKVLQHQYNLLYKSIVPYRLMGLPLIEEIIDE